MARLEELGIPTVALCTTGFEAEAAEQWAQLGFTDGQAAFVGHPFSSLRPEEVAREAAAAADQVAGLLLAAGDGAGRG